MLDALAKAELDYMDSDDGMPLDVVKITIRDALKEFCKNENNTSHNQRRVNKQVDSPAFQNKKP